LARDDDHDVIVVGGGAAGVSCALECFDIKLDIVLFESAPQPGGQLAEIPHAIRNVAAWRYGAGAPLLREFDVSAAILGERIRRSQPVTRVDLAERWVEAAGTRVSARCLVLATGTRRQELPGAPEGAFGGDVTYLVESRPGHFTGRAVVVIGGGDSATLDALELAREGCAVTLVHRGSALSARDDIVQQIRDEPRVHDLGGWELDSLHGGDRLEEVGLRSPAGERMRVPAGGLVVKIARVPRTELFRDQVELDARGAIVVDPELRTSRPGVMAAGDVVAHAYPRVATALGQGVLAARSVLRHVQGRS
jgi:thioredoxin reductase (NADPH)